MKKQDIKQPKKPAIVSKRFVSGSSQTKEWIRPTHENGKCLHNVGSQDSDGYFRCLYCEAVVEDVANYR